MFELSKAVGNNFDNHPEDVFKIKDTLSDIGYFDFDSNPAEPHGIFTRELDEGIKDFQKDNALRVDGILKPKGETEQALKSLMPPIGRTAPRRKPWSENPSEFDATGRRIRDQKPSLFEALAVSFAEKDTGFSEELIKKKLQERQVRLAAVPVPQEKPVREEEESKPVEFDATGRMIRSDESSLKETQTKVPVPKEKPLDLPILRSVDTKKVVIDVIKEEGDPAKIDFMFKDTAAGGGKVTVAGGILLDTVAKAKKLPFTLPDGKGGRRRATEKEIEQAFNKVNAIKQPSVGEKHVAESFEPGSKTNLDKTHKFDDLRLPAHIAQREFDKRIRTSAHELRGIFKDFDSFPPSGQQAILDMHFNLGSTKFRESRIVKNPKTGKLENKGWPNLFAAIKRKDWKAAAQESKRGGVSQKRNDRTKAKFLKAVKGK